jgi:hypothetical protein
MWHHLSSGITAMKAYAKAENDEETEVLCLKRMKTEPKFCLFTFFATLRYAIDTSLCKLTNVSIVLERLLIYIYRKQYYL